MPTVRTTLEPWRDISVSEGEYLYLLRQGLIYTGEPVAPPPTFTDAQYAELANPDGEAAQRVLAAALDLVNEEGIASSVAATALAAIEPEVEAMTTAASASLDGKVAVANAAASTATTAKDDAETARDEAIDAATTLSGTVGDVAALDELTTTGRLSEAGLTATIGEAAPPRGERKYLDDFYEESDDGDWALTLTRAVAAVASGEAIYLTSIYPFRTAATLASERKIIGYGEHTGFAWDRAAGAVPTSLINQQYVDDLWLDNFRVIGGVQAGDADITSGPARTIQLRDGERLRVSRLHVSGSPDWALSFVRCDDVTVTQHRHSGGGYGYPGGRDGIHFLDCSNFYVDGADIHSGDDCIGITTETVGTSMGVVRNVRGRSELGSIVICNEEGATTFPASDLTIEQIAAVGSARNIVRVRSNNLGTEVKNVTIRGISGTSTVNAAIEVFGNATHLLKNLAIEGVNVKGNSNGIQAGRLNGFDISGVVIRETVGSTGDGVVLNYANNGTVAVTVQSCSRWGVSLNFCNRVIVRSVASECGAAQFANSTGGGLSITNSTAIRVSGSYYGSPATSYWGIFQSGNTDAVIAADTIRGGATP